MRVYLIAQTKTPSPQFEKALDAIGGFSPRGKGKYVAAYYEGSPSYISDVLRETLRPYFGKEQALRRLKEDFDAILRLEIVPELVANSDVPLPCLSLDGDIIKFLYLSGAEHDLDLYVL